MWVSAFARQAFTALSISPCFPFLRKFLCFFKKLPELGKVFCTEVQTLPRVFLSECKGRLLREGRIKEVKRTEYNQGSQSNASGLRNTCFLSKIQDCYMEKSKSQKRRQRKYKIRSKLLQENKLAKKNGCKEAQQELNHQQQTVVNWTLETIPKSLKKYYEQRYTYFDLFDDGIQTDATGWFSVTPQIMADCIAERFKRNGAHSVVDAFCGIGGNAIAFARMGLRVIAIDNDLTRLKCAINNARIYNVSQYISFIHADFIKIAPTLFADAVFLSPPWGGPTYQQSLSFDIKNDMPISALLTMKQARKISKNICLYMPRNILREQLIDLGENETVEIEEMFLDGRLKVVNSYYGTLAGSPTC